MQRPLAPHWVEEVFEDERNLDFVSGVAVHWYVDEYLGLPNALDRVHEEFPDKFILYTEACNGGDFFLRNFCIREMVNFQATSALTSSLGTGTAARPTLTT